MKINKIIITITNITIYQYFQSKNNNPAPSGISPKKSPKEYFDWIVSVRPPRIQEVPFSMAMSH